MCSRWQHGGGERPPPVQTPGGNTVGRGELELPRRRPKVYPQQRVRGHEVHCPFRSFQGLLEGGWKAAKDK